MYVVMFNGPPRCGKDSVAQCLATILDHETNLPVKIDHFARPMRQAAMTLAGLNPKDFALYNRVKDAAQPLLNGMTIREFMIWLSERVMKRRFGQDYWGRAVMKDHVDFPGILLIPDLGFLDEGGYVVGQIDSPNTLVVRMSRPEITWANDSRRYVSLLCPTLDLVNDKSIQDAADLVLGQMRALDWRL